MVRRFRLFDGIGQGGPAASVCGGVDPDNLRDQLVLGVQRNTELGQHRSLPDQILRGVPGSGQAALIAPNLLFALRSVLPTGRFFTGSGAIDDTEPGGLRRRVERIPQRPEVARHKGRRAREMADVCDQNASGQLVTSVVQSPCVDHHLFCGGQSRPLVDRAIIDQDLHAPDILRLGQRQPNAGQSPGRRPKLENCPQCPLTTASLRPRNLPLCGLA